MVAWGGRLRWWVSGPPGCHDDQCPSGSGHTGCQAAQATMGYGLVPLLTSPASVHAPWTLRRIYPGCGHGGSSCDGWRQSMPWLATVSVGASLRPWLRPLSVPPTGGSGGGDETLPAGTRNMTPASPVALVAPCLERIHQNASARKYAKLRQDATVRLRMGSCVCVCAQE